MLRMLGWPLLPLAGGAPRPYCLIHVADVVEGLLAAEAGANMRGEAYNLAGAPATLPQMARWRAAGGRAPYAVPVPDRAMRIALSLRWFLKHVRHPGKPGIWRSYLPGHTDGSLLLGGPVYDTAKAERELGFRPAMDLEETLRAWADPPVSRNVEFPIKHQVNW
jgi:nucleoside-diphosphate-sugar epimerase